MRHRLLLALIFALCVPGPAWAVSCGGQCNAVDCGVARKIIVEAHESESPGSNNDRLRRKVQAAFDNPIQPWKTNYLANQVIIPNLRAAARQHAATVAAAIDTKAAAIDALAATEANELLAVNPAKYATAQFSINEGDDLRLATATALRGLRGSRAANEAALEPLKVAATNGWLKNRTEREYPTSLVEALKSCPGPLPPEEIMVNPGLHLDLEDDQLCLQALFAVPFAALPLPPSDAEMAKGQQGEKLTANQREHITSLGTLSDYQKERWAPTFPGASNDGAHLRAWLLETGLPEEEVLALLPRNPSPREVLDYTTLALTSEPHIASIAGMTPEQAERLALATQAGPGRETRGLTGPANKRTNALLVRLLSGMQQAELKQMAIGARQQVALAPPPAPTPARHAPGGP
ncbi:MAG TPA: hypothetical protein DDX54_06865, partial [Rhodospirillaceae bacterium]|nr:hypothetical protein [Rhodospirillaceae bacterium]